MVSKEIVIGLLKDNPQGLSIEDISSKLKVHRQTIRVIIAELKGAKEVIERRVGMTKLYYWDFKPKGYVHIEK